MVKRIQWVWWLLFFFYQVGTLEGLTTIMTLFTFHTSNVPWNVASRKCREEGTDSRLVNVDTKSKADLIKRLHAMEPWLNLSKTENQKIKFKSTGQITKHDNDFTTTSFWRPSSICVQFKVELGPYYQCDDCYPPSPRDSGNIEESTSKTPIAAVDYWIGLHSIDHPYGSDFRWTRTCAQPTQWTNWHDGEPRNYTDNYCTRNVKPDYDWKTYDCIREAPFICEEPLIDDNCVIKSVHVEDYPHSDSSTGMDVIEVHKLLNESVSSCIVLCLTEVKDDMECWAGYTNGDTCILFYANTTIFLESSADNTNNTLNFLFVKDCYLAEVKEDEISYFQSEVVHTPNVCTDTTTTEAATTATSATDLQTTTPELQTSELQTTTATSNPITSDDTTGPQATTSRQDTTSSTTFSSNVFTILETTLTTTTSTPSPTTIPITTEAVATTTATTKGTPTTTAQHNTTMSTTTTTTEKPARVVVASACECFCDSVTVKEPAPTLSPRQKEEFVIQIVQSLTLNISSISATRRKLTSASDPRPSARRVGVIGIILISIVFGGILILDMPGLVMDIRNLFHNIKSGLGYESVAEVDKKI